MRFFLRWVEGAHEYKIYASGEIEGFADGALIVNYLDAHPAIAVFEGHFLPRFHSAGNYTTVIYDFFTRSLMSSTPSKKRSMVLSVALRSVPLTWPGRGCPRIFLARATLGSAL